MENRIEIQLLGILRVLRDEQPVSGFRSRKALALLGYLAAHEHALLRTHLVDLFWPYMPEARGRANLSWAINHLSEWLPNLFVADRQSVGLRKDASVEVDTREFSALLERAESNAHPDSQMAIAALTQAAALYRGDFMSGQYLDDCPGFEQWLLHQQELWRQRTVKVLNTLSTHHHQRGEDEAALRVVDQWLSLTPWQEEVHQRKMELLAGSGQWSLALQQYEACRRILNEELGVAPGAETTALYERIRKHDSKLLRLSVASTPFDSGAIATTGAPPGKDQEQVKYTQSVPHNLPRQFSTFMGRQAEIEQLLALLNEEKCGLVTLLGPGGIGKTRLALAVTEKLLGRFTHGVWFVALAGLQIPDSSDALGNTANEALVQEHIASAIGSVLNVPFVGKGSLLQQLRQFLHRKELLLVLDNFEHLSAGTTLITTLLQDAPQLKILVTSRRRLDLQAEYIVRVDGLAWPDQQTLGRLSSSAVPNSKLMSYTSVALFFERAHRIAAPIAPTHANQLAISQICQMLEGLPLGIELAASLSDQYEPVQLEHSLRSQLQILTISSPDVPARQRSLHAVVHYSWQLIDEAERTLLMHCAYFRSGFTQEAAEQVADAQHASLTKLVHHSLLHQTEEGRFQMHEVVRRFAMDRLHENPQTEQNQRRRHCEYYTLFLGRWFAEANDRIAAQAQIVIELDNLRAAWAEAVQSCNLPAIDHGILALQALYNGLGLFAEAEAAFTVCVAMLSDMSRSDEASQSVQKRLWAECLYAQSYYARLAGRLAQATELATEGLQISLKLGDARSITRGHIRIVQIQVRLGEYEKARTVLEAGLALARSNGFIEMESELLLLLATCASDQGLREFAIDYLHTALPLAKQVKATAIEQNLLINLGVIHMELGNYASGMSYYQQSLALSQQLNDRLRGSNALLNIGASYKMVGEFAQALVAIEEALTIFRSSGDVYKEIAALAEIGLLYHYLNDLPQALHYGSQALTLAKSYPMHFVRTFAHMSFGLSNLSASHWQSADENFDEAYALCQKSGQSDFALVAKAGLAAIALQNEELTVAQSHVEEILTQMQSTPLDATADPGFVYLNCYRVLRATNNTLATKILQDSHNYLLAQSEKIDNDALRHSFLHNVPSNRTLIALYREFESFPR